MIEIPEQAVFKSTRIANGFLGVGLLVLAGCVSYIVLFIDEDQFLHTRTRRGGGLMKLIEQTIGWEFFIVLMVLFGT